MAPEANRCEVTHKEQGAKGKQMYECVIRKIIKLHEDPSAAGYDYE